MSKQELMIIFYNPIIRNQKLAAHWALFVPEESGSPIGTLVHLTVQKLSGIAKGPATAQTIENYRITTSNKVYSMFTIPGAKATAQEVKVAADSVWNQNSNKNYDVVSNNCQIFVAGVLTQLHEMCPTDVPQTAIDSTPQKLDEFLKEIKGKAKGKATQILNPSHPELVLFEYF